MWVLLRAWVNREAKADMKTLAAIGRAQWLCVGAISAILLGGAWHVAHSATADEATAQPVTSQVAAPTSSEKSAPASTESDSKESQPAAATSADSKTTEPTSAAAASTEPEKKSAEPQPETPPSEVTAEPAAPLSVEQSAAHRGPTSVTDLEAFLDGILTIQLKDRHIAGATISVVVDDKPFFAKGYGYADVAAKKPVDAEVTMFRIGSVSKLFTWTAVMQLAEQGKLDLDADVNKYLTDFKVPETYSKPITLKHLMSHTPGFEDQVIGLFARSPDKTPLGEILARDLPARVRAVSIGVVFEPRHGPGRLHRVASGRRTVGGLHRNEPPAAASDAAYARPAAT